MLNEVNSVKSIKEAARKEFMEERANCAKKALIAQMRIVDQAEVVLKAAKLKLADIEQQIEDGTL